MAADASVGGIPAVDVSFVHADAITGQAHPVEHGSADELAAFGDFVLAGVGVGFGDFSCGIVDGAVEVGSFVFDLFGDAEVAGGGVIFTATTGGYPVVDSDLVIDEEKAPLGGDVDPHAGVAWIGGSEEGIVFPGAGGAGIFFGFEVIVGSRGVGVDESGLLGICDRGSLVGGRGGAAAGEKKASDEEKCQGEKTVKGHGAMCLGGAKYRTGSDEHKGQEA